MKRGSKLTMLRKAFKMTQRDLARILARSVHSLRAIEQGKFGIGEHLAAQMSHITGVSSAWLLDDSPGPPVDKDGHEITLASLKAHVVAVAASDGLLRLDPMFLAIRLETSLKKAGTLRNYPSIAERVTNFLNELDREIKAAESKRKRP
jgi:transcriptional regulator with XRE-family HTH domain